MSIKTKSDIQLIGLFFLTSIFITPIIFSEHSFLIKFISIIGILICLFPFIISAIHNEQLQSKKQTDFLYLHNELKLNETFKNKAP